MSSLIETIAFLDPNNFEAKFDFFENFFEEFSILCFYSFFKYKEEFFVDLNFYKLSVIFKALFFFKVLILSLASLFIVI